MQILKDLLIFVQILSALGLIVLVISQTTKSEGLTGTIGGKASASFRGKPGIDDKLADFTKWCAIAFMSSSALVYLLSVHRTPGA